MVTLSDIGAWLVSHWVITAASATASVFLIRSVYHVFVRMRRADLADEEIAAVTLRLQQALAKEAVLAAKVVDLQTEKENLLSQLARLKAENENLQAQIAKPGAEGARLREPPAKAAELRGGFAPTKTPPGIIPLTGH